MSLLSSTSKLFRSKVSQPGRLFGALVAGLMLPLSLFMVTTSALAQGTAYGTGSFNSSFYNGTSPTPTVASNPQGPDTGYGTPAGAMNGWVWLAFGVAILLIALGIFLFLARRRQTKNASPNT